MSGWLLVFYGFAVAVILMTFGVWLPSRAYWRRQLDDLREIHRIEGGYRAALSPEATQPLLDDARGAFAAARAAYLAIYPGRNEPDPAWIAWIEQTGFAYTEVRGYQPSHGSALPSPAPAPEPDPFPLDRTGLPHPAIWGLACTCDQCTGRLPSRAATWKLAWAWHERMLVPFVLVLAYLDRPGRYPWWQRVADRFWEAGVVFEVSGARVNQRLTDALDDLLVGAVTTTGSLVYAVGWLAATMAEALVSLVDAVATPINWWAQWRARRRVPGFRPKRYYPIKEG